MGLEDVYSGQQPQKQKQQKAPGLDQSAAYVRGRQNLAHMAQARQRFTNDQFAKAQQDMAAAKQEAAKQKEMSKRTAYGMTGTGAMLGMMYGGPAGGLAGAGIGLGVGILGEMGTRMGDGDNFFEALGSTVGRLPTSAEVMSAGQQVGTGMLMQQARANQPGGRGLPGAPPPATSAQQSLQVRPMHENPLYNYRDPMKTLQPSGLAAEYGVG